MHIKNVFLETTHVLTSSPLTDVSMPFHLFSLVVFSLIFASLLGVFVWYTTNAQQNFSN